MMGCYIKTGYVHLINMNSDTLTISEQKFDTVSGIGLYLEKAINKILDNHNRRPAEFKSNSQWEGLFKNYTKNEMGLNSLSTEIVYEIYEAKKKENILENTIVFVLEGDKSVYVLEIERSSCFVIVPEEAGKNVIYEETLVVPPVKANSLSFIEYDIENNSINVLEKIKDNNCFLYADVVFKLDLKPSFQQRINDARRSFYNAVIKAEDREADLNDFRKKTDIDFLNQFEERLNKELKAKGEINFLEMSDELFESDVNKRSKFLELLKRYGINKTIVALSRAPIKLKTLEYIKKKITLKNGVQIFVPENVEEVEVNLKEVDGEFKEITEAG